MASQIVFMIKDESTVKTNINSTHSWQVDEERVLNTLGSLGSVHTELLTIALAMPKKWKLNIINGTIHTGLSKILSDSYACGKRQIFTKDFTKEWVGYVISLASIAIAKESLFGIVIAKSSVNGPLELHSHRENAKAKAALISMTYHKSASLSV